MYKLLFSKRNQSSAKSGIGTTNSSDPRSFTVSSKTDLLKILIKKIKKTNNAQLIPTLILELSQGIKKPCQRLGFERADEEIRTLDILLGKEMLYH